MKYQGILQARLNSSRLPGKMLMRFGEETVLEFVIKRLRHCRLVQHWVLATTDTSADDELVDVAVKLNMPVYRGSQDDVLDRLYQCARQFGMEHIVRVGGDNPLIDPRIIDETIESYEKDKRGWDYFSNHHPPTFPDGQEVEIMPFRSLEKAWMEAKLPHEREHGTPFLWDQPNLFRVGNYSRPGENLYYKHRWTLDYQEDLDLLHEIVKAFPGRHDFSQEEICDLLERKPEVYAINLTRHGETWHAKERDRLQTVGQYRQLTDREFAREIQQRRRKVCCITGSRAEYSRLKSVLAALKIHEQIELQVVCTGTHLLERYGHSIDDLTDDGLDIAATCFMLVEGETLTTMSKSIGLAIIEFSSILSNMQPDILLVMGDRFEALASAVAGVTMNIPLAHIQGGELSGSLDESMRHAITKLSHIHFPSTELSRQRIISMGEDPSRVFNVGCPAVDTLLRIPPLSTKEILAHPAIAPKRANRRPFSADEGYVLCLFHPVTTEYELVSQETMELLHALDSLKENVFWLWPNADAGARKIIRTVDGYLAKRRNERFDFFDHIPMELFVSLLARAKLMVGNSSAGIREACYFGVPVVNVGRRQLHRERPPNVADVEVMDRDKILAAMREQLSRGKFPLCQLFGEGKAGQKIADLLATIRVERVQKEFHDHFRRGYGPSPV